MYIKTLTVNKFRNYEHEFVELCPNTNVFYGNNAQGKTNLLEAVYLFSHGRSHRARSDSELVKFNENVATLELNFADSNREYNALMRFSREGKKQIKINNVPIKKLSMLMSYLNVVIFSPEDLEMVKGAPTVRRRFIDEALSQLYPNYLVNLINYHKALVQKNSLLKNLRYSQSVSDDVLSVWNEQLAEFGSAVYKYRLEFIDTISKLAKPIHTDIASEVFDISYQPGIKITGEKNSFFEVLEQNQRREIEVGTSLVGIQRDDFKIYTAGNEAKVFASQGQQRTCVLSLKMAETEFIKSVRDEYPVLLLDDIMSELDINRRSFLWERITDKQVLLTCTDTDAIKNNDSIALFRIDNGKIIR